ncbi:protein of unknown function DUF2577 [Gottschalkia purinilytica]|uniref:Uncharacterized protein n=1 Tax=Gottschalkia purinilytica TaxID=1503 RepID=A0A0L0W7B8_GOTPU|nr:DUF2577 family protein [Gottschalkia purinilytica]KNF07175.1 protein of unknown function DUF2577 [Gottschalkia purinilytica]
MRNNPYSEILSIMREQADVNNIKPINLATVTSSSPLKIKVLGLEIDSSNILIGDHIEKEKPLLVGDRVVVALMSDMQTFTILARVINR